MSGEERAAARGGFGLERLNAFSDGVLAIVITLLVLTLEVPDDFDFETLGWTGFLHELQHKIRAYIAGFILVATYWIQHVAIMRSAEFATRSLLWLTIAFLLPVSLVPFVVELHATYPAVVFSTVAFGSIHVASFAVLLVNWRYIISRCRERSRPVPATSDRSITTRLLIAMLLSSISIATTFTNAAIGALVFLSVPCLFLSHRAADHVHRVTADS